MIVLSEVPAGLPFCRFLEFLDVYSSFIFNKLRVSTLITSSIVLLATLSQAISSRRWALRNFEGIVG